MTIYQPSQVRLWSAPNFEALTGKRVAVRIDGVEAEGWVACSNPGNHPCQPIIGFRDGRAVSWLQDADDVTIRVTEEEP